MNQEPMSAEQIVASLASQNLDQASKKTFAEKFSDHLSDLVKQPVGTSASVEIAGVPCTATVLSSATGTVNVATEPHGVLLSAWQPGTNVPGNDGEYEVVDPITGMVSRATWDSLFEAWSCEAQYPTWRGVL